MSDDFEYFEKTLNPFYENLKASEKADRDFFKRKVNRVKIEFEEKKEQFSKWAKEQQKVLSTQEKEICSIVIKQASSIEEDYDQVINFLKQSQEDVSRKECKQADKYIQQAEKSRSLLLDRLKQSLAKQAESMAPPVQITKIIKTTNMTMPPIKPHPALKISMKSENQNEVD